MVVAAIATAIPRGVRPDEAGDENTGDGAEATEHQGE
jgi:hypothetical protein